MKETALRTLRHEVQENSEKVERIVTNILNEYARDLDNEIDKIRHILDNSDEMTDNEIENITMRLPVFMYYSVNGLENLGIESDMAKAVKLEVYNNKYLESTGTIADKTHDAELQTMNEQIIETAFIRAYKKLKAKIDKAEHVFSGAKKVLSKRIQDAELHRVDKYT